MFKLCLLSLAAAAALAGYPVLAQTNIGSISLVLLPGQKATLYTSFNSAWENSVGVRDSNWNLLGVWNNQNAAAPASGSLELRNDTKEPKLFVVAFNHKEGPASAQLEWLPSTIKLHYKLDNTYFYGAEDGGDATFLDAQVKIVFTEKKVKPRVED